jgi:mannose-1-phosphate guanylyltransferase/phosphomannomutase
MAGGRSERMRATSGVHKALMQVRGKSLIEWSLQTLIQEGFQDIVVSISADNSEIEQFLIGRGREIAEAADAKLITLKESIPLGTIGAVAIAIRGFDALLVVNVDNLTDLPLRRFVEFHLNSGSDLTIASHNEPFQIPFGQLVIENGEVLDYLEKPLLPISISSGTYVIGPNASELIEPGKRFDVTHLFRLAKANGLKVSAFEHTCFWIDINDEPALRKAECILAEKEGKVGAAT